MLKAAFLAISLLVVIHIYPQACFVRSQQIAVFNWDASKGTLPRYIAGVADTCQAYGYLIVLGYDSTNLYIVEAGLEDDARGGNFAQLVVVDSTGHTTKHILFNGDQLQNYLETDSIGYIRNKLALTQLWKLCSNKTIEPKKLNRLKYKKSQADSPTIQIQHPVTQQLYSWEFNATPSMCWCYYKWLFTKSK